MRDWQSVAHVRGECKYHIVWVPKYRRKTLYGKDRRRFGRSLRNCQQRAIELIEGHETVDHVHVCLGFPPRYSIGNVVGFLKGKSAIRLHREFSDQRTGSNHLWIRGYYVSAKGLDDKKVREYTRNQETLDKDQMVLNSFDRPMAPSRGTLLKPLPLVVVVRLSTRWLRTVTSALNWRCSNYAY